MMAITYGKASIWLRGKEITGFDALSTVEPTGILSGGVMVETDHGNIFVPDDVPIQIVHPLEFTGLLGPLEEEDVPDWNQC